MRRLLTCMSVFVVAATWAADPEVRFVAVDLWSDSGDRPLAAYQVDIRYDARRVRVVGVEGGDHAAFVDPPHYDPKGMAGGRITLAAFSAVRDLPTGKARLARLHLQVEGKAVPELNVELVTAGTATGSRIEVDLSLEPMKGERGK
ncbi:MAG: hypothetical protein HN742_26135 [Lentisphaerae bacterium]|jgi:hypothetical protein|nr:hypothetical protein [Lentisphaerota bacterium]MBT4817217.1 hypothetical protein [Lentisphaerota bacterium]MBT5605556.1 hypothetical protein [Lentisphaerota bacterium]MBT7056833.1 hypothetical protein [Lentisphaerota bacterium]MBT7845381.1 hypothetical protein [Lentisphaerota bacterium]